jgi:hypothetical protein
MRNLTFLRKQSLVIICCLFMMQTVSALNFKFVYCPNNLQTFPQNVRDSIEKAGKTLGSYIGNTHTVTIVVKSEVTADAVGTGSPKTAKENTDIKYIALSGVYTINPTANANFVVLTQHELLHILGVTGGLNAFKNKISNSAFTGSKTKQMNNGNAFPLSGGSHLSRAAAYPLPGMNAAVRDGGGSFSVMDLALLFDLGYDIPLLTTRTTAVHPLPTGTVANTSNSDVCEDLSTISPELFISNRSKQIVNINKCFCATPQYNVNGGGFSNTLPTYNATTPLTIQVKYVCDNDNTKQSPTKTFNTYPICPVDLSSVVTGAVRVTESVNGVGGLIEAPTVSNCPPGSNLSYAINDSWSFSDALPTYDKTKSMTIKTRCFCESDGSKGSKVTTVTTKPGISTTTPPTPVPAPAPATIAPAVPTSGRTINSSSNVVALNSSITSGLSSGDAITVEYWFKGTQLQSPVRFQEGQNFIVAGWGEAEPVHLLSNEGFQKTLAIKTKANSSVEDSKWHHIAFTWSKGVTKGFKSYVDGELIEEKDASSNSLPAFTAFSGTLGAWSVNGSYLEFLNGELARVRIWKTARTATQILESRGRSADYANDASLLYQAAVPGANAVSVSPTPPTPAPIVAAVPTTGRTFNGTSDVVSLNNSIATGLSGGSAVTIEYWFKGTNLQSAVRLQGTSGDYIVAGWGGTPMHIISTDNGTNGVNIKTASSVNVHDNQWHHVAMTWEKNKTDGFKSYVDGVLVAKRTSGNVNLPNLTGVTPVLGAFVFNGARSEFTNGQLDRIRIWNVARTEAQIIESRGRSTAYPAETSLLYQGNGN